MQFEPIGGFPPIVRSQDDKINQKNLETRGFATTNIVSIGDIISRKKEQDLYFAFGSDEEDGYDAVVNNIIYTEPYNYN